LVPPIAFELLKVSGKRDLNGFPWVGAVRKEAFEENRYECECAYRIFGYDV
jgi:hypothetical protein